LAEVPLPCLDPPSLLFGNEIVTLPIKPALAGTRPSGFSDDASVADRAPFELYVFSYDWEAAVNLIR